MSQVSSFITQEIQNSLGDSSAASTLANVTWQYTESSSMPLVLQFDISATYGDGLPVPASQEYEALKVDQNDLTNLIQNFIWSTSPGSTVAGESLFQDVNRINLVAHTIPESSGNSSTGMCLED
jgi:hypothetical protein